MIVIRPMAFTDVDSVFYIEEASSFSPWSKKILQDCIRVGYVCLVLENTLTDSVIGFLIFMISQGECHLLNIAIAPREREGGHGRYLLNHMIEIAREQNVERILLEVRVSNKIALHLYQTLGFVKVGIRKNYYQTKDNREDAILMTLFMNCVA